MGKSKITINKCEQGYRFEIVPSNNRAPLAFSPIYKSHNECEVAKEAFCNLVLTNKLDSLKAPFVKISKEEADGVPKYYYRFYDADGTMVLYRKKGYYKRSECEKGIGRIYRIVSENK